VSPSTRYVLGKDGKLYYFNDGKNDDEKDKTQKFVESGFNKPDGWASASTDILFSSVFGMDK